MNRELFEPSVEAEARLLLLIAAFSGPNKSLEGRTKLAKLDFLLRYPRYFARAIRKRDPRPSDIDEVVSAETEGVTIESRMIRYRFGPWDPAYFALIGRLVGKQLVQPIPSHRGIGYRVTQVGERIARSIATDPEWATTAKRARLLRRYLDLTGTNLMHFVYETFPEVAGATWGEAL